MIEGLGLISHRVWQKFGTGITRSIGWAIEVVGLIGGLLMVAAEGEVEDEVVGEVMGKDLVQGVVQALEMLEATITMTEDISSIEKCTGIIGVKMKVMSMTVLGE